MALWRRLAGRFAHALEKEFETRRAELAGPAPAFAGVDIVPFRSFGTADALHVRGRVLRDRGVTEVSEHTPVWRNVLDAYRRFESDEIPGAGIVARVGGTEATLVTDEEGYFHDVLQGVPESGAVWREVALELEDDPASTATAEVLVPPADSEFGVISDLDDTVIQTGATALMTMVKSVVLHNARTRLPFEGVAELYAALLRGRGGSGANPIFYVSSGPWNLYDLYADFLDFHGIPPGPIMLGDYGVDESMLIHRSHDEHKLEVIRGILDTYPSMRFVLSGDSGQRDPEIYAEVVKSAPGRISAVYLRDVTLDPRGLVVREIGAGFSQQKVEFVYADRSEALAAHARTHGLIS